MQTIFRLFVTIICLSISFKATTQDQPHIRIYLDSDRSRHFESAWSIELGLRAALEAVGNQIQGRKVELVLKDHRGNAKRSKKHMDEFKEDPNALFIMAGLHSPPLIRYRKHINENEILILVPWAAGGPITRYPNIENWVFRLSVDDTKAGARIVDFTLNNQSCKTPHFLLEETPWGESNFKSMTKAFAQMNTDIPDVSWFGWNISSERADTIIKDILSKETDCIIMVANSIEGKLFIDALDKANKKLPVISHWGITGGNFHETIPETYWQKNNLFFIQSCFDFIESQSNEKKHALQMVKKLYPEKIKSEYDIPAIAGFIHSYDLAKVFLQAVSQIEIGTNMLENRRKLRIALENIDSSVPGLIKTYHLPFSAYSEKNLDFHEALDLNDLCMGYFGNKNEVKIIPHQ